MTQFLTKKQQNLTPDKTVSISKCKSDVSHQQKANVKLDYSRDKCWPTFNQNSPPKMKEKPNKGELINS